jgi:tetratricopeptide (TPR) repeat protein
MKNLTISIFTVLFVIGISSCKKYLAIKSDAKMVVPRSLDDLQGILDDADNMNLSRTPSLGQSVSDDLFLPPATIAGRDASTKLLYSWQPFDYRFGNDWSSAYLPVYNSNLCLEILETIPRTTGNAAAWDNVRGSALFFRAYYFYALTAQYGKAFNAQTSETDAGIVLRLGSDFNVRSERSSVKACLDQVKKDLDEAVLLLPNLAVNSLRPSKAACWAMLSRVNLYMRDYERAMFYASQALSLQNGLINFNGDSDLLGIGLNVPFKKFNKETIFYSEMNTFSDIAIPTRARTDTVLFAKYNANDLRRTAFFRLVSGYQQFKGSYASHAVILFSGLATDEMYLNRAEGKAWTGDITGAMDDLNTLLKTRWKSTVPYIAFAASTKAAALGLIREERRKELVMRSMRFSDLKRLNVEGADITLTRVMDGKVYSLLPNAPFYALPLPVDILEQTGIPQN